MSIALVVGKFLESGTAKSLIISALVTTGGFVLKQQVHEAQSDQTLAWHTEAIRKIHDHEETAAQALVDHTVTLARIEGKLDTVNQKIDDDRNYAERHQVRSTR